MKENHSKHYVTMRFGGAVADARSDGVGRGSLNG